MNKTGKGSNRPFVALQQKKNSRVRDNIEDTSKQKQQI
jgi:hypothetical protein